MTLCRVARWLVAGSLALSSGSVSAALEDCLAYRDNPHVAACANQYGSRASAARPHAFTAAVQPVAKPVNIVADPELKSVPVVRVTKAAAPAPEPEPQTFAVDDQALINTIIAGAVGGSLLVLVALGGWRWAASRRKDCPWCGSKIGKTAQTCPSCFRAL